ncbi:MAG TPA: AAA family ATPase [Nannocystis sp.]
MRVQRLKLENFRGFRALDLDLSVGNTTVIVGINGAGKTAILDALAIALSHLEAEDLAAAEAGIHPQKHDDDVERLVLSSTEGPKKAGAATT